MKCVHFALFAIVQCFSTFVSPLECETRILSLAWNKTLPRLSDFREARDILKGILENNLPESCGDIVNFQ